jgi:hypothetical protein
MDRFSGNCNPRLFGMYWHKTVRDVLALTLLFKKDTVARKAGSLRLFPGLVEAGDRRHSPGSLLVSL